MSNDFCLDCGILLSPHTRICAVCGFDNNHDELPENSHWPGAMTEDSEPDHYTDYSSFEDEI